MATVELKLYQVFEGRDKFYYVCKYVIGKGHIAVEKHFDRYTAEASAEQLNKEAEEDGDYLVMDWEE